MDGASQLSWDFKDKSFQCQYSEDQNKQFLTRQNSPPSAYLPKHPKKTSPSHSKNGGATAHLTDFK